jgi:S1-C subfamily serine protease
VYKRQDIVLATYVNKKKIGESVSVKIWRDKKETEITVVLGKKS